MARQEEEVKPKEALAEIKVVRTARPVLYFARRHGIEGARGPATEDGRYY